MGEVDGFVDPSKDDLLAMLEREWAEWEALVLRVRAISVDMLRAHPVTWQRWPASRWLIHLTHEHYPEHVPGLQGRLAGAA
jgi:hypothetical protein